MLSISGMSTFVRCMYISMAYCIRQISILKPQYHFRWKSTIRKEPTHSQYCKHNIHSILQEIFILMGINHNGSVTNSQVT